MISIEDARRLITAKVHPLPSATTPLAEAIGGVLAADVLADATYPSADRSMMDGYVIRADESPGSFLVSGEIQAGAVPSQALGKGEAMRIFTGAILPENGGRILMQEDVSREGERISVTRFAEKTFIRRQGSEAAAGDPVLRAGTSLGAAELAILAQVGATHPEVIRRPVVRHLATGNELVAPAEVPAPGQIRDTNSTLLVGLLGNLGVSLIDSRRVADDPGALTHLAEGDWDLLLVSGGASVGDYDFGAEALGRLGFTTHFDRVNLRPGKPLTFATRGHQAAFVIPGNPVSHFVCFHVAIRLAVELMMGKTPSWDFLALELMEGESLLPDPRDTFWPANAVHAAGKLAVSPKRWSTSGDTFSLVGTNALVRVNLTSPADGVVQTLLLDLPAAR